MRSLHCHKDQSRISGARQSGPDFGACLRQKSCFSMQHWYPRSEIGEWFKVNKLQTAGAAYEKVSSELSEELFLVGLGKGRRGQVFLMKMSPIFKCWDIERL